MDEPLLIALMSSDFANLPAPDFAAKPSKTPSTSEHSMGLVGGQQLAYRSIYRLEPRELATVQTYQ